MTRLSKPADGRIRRSRFPFSIFGMIFVALLLMSGVHTWILLGMDYWTWPDIVRVHVILLYWALVSALLTLYIRWRMGQAYEAPLQKLSQAAEQVAKGDFSVKLTLEHDSEHLDYLDVMMLDVNKMIQELSGLETLRTDFLSNVSHELKTPLAVIQNYAVLLKAPDLTEEQRLEYAGAISEASRRLSNLITNILKLNKLENQQIYPTARRYNLGEQLCECLLQFETAWEQKGLKIESSVEALFVNADPELLSLVWNNLFSNAIKFTEPGGTVSVSLRTEDGFAVVQVEDTGCGMSRETGTHIFEKFYQGDPSHAAQGNGLGLALVKRVVDITNGEILVKSTLGEGSVFTVRLPIEA